MVDAPASVAPAVRARTSRTVRCGPIVLIRPPICNSPISGRGLQLIDARPVPVHGWRSQNGRRLPGTQYLIRSRPFAPEEKLINHSPTIWRMFGELDLVWTSIHRPHRIA